MQFHINLLDWFRNPGTRKSNFQMSDTSDIVNKQLMFRKYFFPEMTCSQTWFYPLIFVALLILNEQYKLDWLIVMFLLHQKKIYSHSESKVHKYERIESNLAAGRIQKISWNWFDFRSFFDWKSQLQTLKFSIIFQANWSYVNFGNHFTWYDFLWSRIRITKQWILW